MGHQEERKEGFNVQREDPGLGERRREIFEVENGKSAHGSAMEL